MSRGLDADRLAKWLIENGYANVTPAPMHTEAGRRVSRLPSTADAMMLAGQAKCVRMTPGPGNAPGR